MWISFLGGQHACAIARSLGMKVVLIHRYSGILSAFGMALADVVHEEQEAANKIYNSSIKHSFYYEQHTYVVQFFFFKRPLLTI